MGGRWGAEVMDRLHLLWFLLTVVILGIAAEKIFPLRPGWVIAGTCGVLVAVISFEGAYRLWDQVSSELASVRESMAPVPLQGRLEVVKSATSADLLFFNLVEAAEFEAEVIGITGVEHVQPTTVKWALLWENNQRRMAILRDSSATLRLVTEYAWPKVKRTLEGHREGPQWQFAGIPAVSADFPLDIDSITIKNQSIRIHIRLHRVEPPMFIDREIVLSVPSLGHFACRVEARTPPP
jgi:hypothetical protein